MCMLTPWTVAHQAPLSMGFLRQEHWSWLPFPPLGDLLDPGIKPVSGVSCFGRWILYHCATWAFCRIRPMPPSSSCMGKLAPRPFPFTITFGFCQSAGSRAISDYLGHSGGVMRSRGVYRSSTQTSIRALSPAMRFLAVTLGGARSQPQRGDCPLQSGPSLLAGSCHQ